MIEFIDRVPATDMANKKMIKYADGSTEIVTITSADDASVSGTAINRTNLMAIQGFVAKTTTFGTDTIVETNANGEELTVTFNPDGSITEKFVGDKTITKTTIFNSDGSITEVLA